VIWRFRTVRFADVSFLRSRKFRSQLTVATFGDIHTSREIKPEPKKDEKAFLIKNPIGYKCGSCNQVIPKLQTERASDYQK